VVRGVRAKGLTRRGLSVIPVVSEAEFHAEHDGIYRFSLFFVWEGDMVS
jgi:hypothetical protein